MSFQEKCKGTTESLRPDMHPPSPPAMDFKEGLRFAQLQAEKCDLKEARISFRKVFLAAQQQGSSLSSMEALAGLLRIAGETGNLEEVRELDAQLDELMKSHPRQVPAMTYYCKGAVARLQNDLPGAKKQFRRYLKAVLRDPKRTEEELMRGWLMIAILLQQENRLSRAQWLSDQILERYEAAQYRGLNGIIYLLKGTLFERQGDLGAAVHWFQKAHGQFLFEHNWYYHLYVLYGYARIARRKQNFAQARWYLELVEKATSAEEFVSLKQEVEQEKIRLQSETIDLVIDSQKGLIQTRQRGPLPLGKQYVLLNILEVLSYAHLKKNSDAVGLSKAEIIQAVWNETYDPEVHDNRLYYNINRIRRLIEPDVHHPQYLLNWKQGYCLAPGLRVQMVPNKIGDKEQGGV